MIYGWIRCISLVGGGECRIRVSFGPKDVVGRRRVFAVAVKGGMNDWQMTLK